MPSKEKSLLQFAKWFLKQLRDDVCLGSNNISPIIHHKESDKITILPALHPANLGSRYTKMNALLTQDSLIKYSKIATLYSRIKTKHHVLIDPKKNPLEYTVAYIEENARQTELNQGGNCGEFTCLAFLNLFNMKFTKRFEFAKFPDEIDHQFIILNRPEKSDPNDWKTWGENTIILDPWINKAFPATQLYKVWKNNPWGKAPADFLTISIVISDSQFKAVKASTNTNYSHDSTFSSKSKMRN